MWNSVRKLAVIVGVSGLSLGCIEEKTYEVDVSTVPDFKWTGRIRITEVTSDEGEFLVKKTRVRSMELVGKDGRNVVVRPTGAAVLEHPIVRVEMVRDSGRGIERILAMMISQSYPLLAKHLIDPNLRIDPVTTQSAVQGQAEADRLLKVLEALNKRRFQEITASEALATAALLNRPTMMEFGINDDLMLKAKIEGKDPPSISVMACDKHGVVLYEYTAVDLAVQLLPKPAP